MKEGGGDGVNTKCQLTQRLQAHMVLEIPDFDDRILGDGYNGVGVLRDDHVLHRRGVTLGGGEGELEGERESHLLHVSAIACRAHV